MITGKGTPPAPSSTHPATGPGTVASVLAFQDLPPVAALVFSDESKALASQHVHHLIDRTPEVRLSGLVRLLETIVDAVDAALRNAPLNKPKVEVQKALTSVPRRLSCPRLAT